MLIDALKSYAVYRLADDCQPTDNISCKAHVELSGASLNGDVYITGNQEALANWNPKGIKMTQINDSTYSIDIYLKLPAEFKFTQGDWDNQIWVKNAVPGNLRITSAAKATKYYETF